MQAVAAPHDNSIIKTAPIIVITPILMKPDVRNMVEHYSIIVAVVLSYIVQYEHEHCRDFDK